MNYESVLPRMRPLFFHQGKVYLSRGSEVLALQEDGKIRKVFSFPDTRRNQLLDRSKLMYRLRRSGVYSASTHKENAYFAYRSQLYHFHYASERLTPELRFDKGNGPLQFSSVKDIKGFADCVVFGEYFGNDNKDPIRIFRKQEEEEWRAVYSFPMGTLNHIHHIVPDLIRNCLWVLGGDFGEAASLWQVYDNFSVVQPVVSGQQQYRACVAFPVEQGLLYATDTQFEPNSIRLLEKKASGWQSSEIARLNGPCIYGCETKDYFVFSTATEPSKEVRNKYLALLDNRPAPHIKENQSDIVICAKSNFDCLQVTAKPKDVWPYRLFQFGSIRFPCGVNCSNTLYSFNIGSKNNDLATEIWQL